MTHHEHAINHYAESEVRYVIGIVPLHIILGDQDFADKCGVSPDEINRWSDQSRTSPKAAACSPEDTISALAPYIHEGREIVRFSLSSSMASTCEVMRMAAEQLDGENLVTVSDSMNLSTDIGLQVIESAEMAQAGCAAVEIKAHIERIHPQVRASFVVDTLSFLHRGSGADEIVMSVRN